MKYYCLSFNYHGHNWDAVKHIRHKDPDIELDHGTYFLIAAEYYVDALAEKAKIEMQHCYSWPDGSLVKYIRTPEPVEAAELKKIFRGPEPLTITRNELQYIVSISLSDVTQEDEHQVHSTRFVSLHERWTLSREELHKLYMHRSQLREEHFSEYHHHRDTCDKCPKPWGVACPEGNRLCTEAQEAARAFIASLRTEETK